LKERSERKNGKVVRAGNNLPDEGFSAKRLTGIEKN